MTPPGWEWLDVLTAWDVIAWIIGGGVVIAGVRWLRPVLVGLKNFLEDWRGEPQRPGRDAVPGVMAQLEAHAEAIADIRKQVKPNHGTSAHDALVRRFDDLQGLVAGALAEIGESRREAAERDKDHSGRLYELEQLVERLRDPHTD